MSTVTVAIPTKNVGKHIQNTLASLELQTRKPDRVLIADSSTDNTREKIEDIRTDLSYILEVFDPGEPGVGAAREALRERTPPGWLFCLDTEVFIELDWIESHLRIHEEHDGEAVVSGTWPGQRVGGTTVIYDAKDPNYFIEANCSMSTGTARRIGGWDADFERGCDWDFRIRLSGESMVNAIASDAAGARPMASNSSPLIHLKKQLNRPSSAPYLNKYGENYLFFHPAHVIGDGIGVTALAAAVTMPICPVAAVWVGLCMAAYAWKFNPPGFSRLDRLLASPAVLLLGWTYLRAVVSR